MNSHVMIEIRHEDGEWRELWSGVVSKDGLVIMLEHAARKERNFWGETRIPTRITTVGSDDVAILDEDVIAELNEAW